MNVNEYESKVGKALNDEITGENSFETLIRRDPLPFFLETPSLQR